MRENVLLEALRSAAEAIQSTKDLHARNKDSAGDILTDADLAVEHAVSDTIKRETGEQILSEENLSSHKKASDPSWSGWVLDPIDGTNNFSRGIPYYCISLAYVEEGHPLLAGILDPVHGDLWTARKGEGAFCNKVPIHVGIRKDFDAGTRVCSSNSTDQGKTKENLLRYEKLPDVWVDFLSSAALNFTYVADGRLDIYHHNGLKPWDNAAGSLILREAGGVAYRLDGKEALWSDSEMVIGNPDLVQEFLRATESV